MKHLPLPNGKTMPALGLGTWELTGQDCYQAVKAAIPLGYRHIDTAQFYGNEEQIGKALSELKVPREELYVTTKVWVTRFKAADLKRSAEESLKKLRLDHVDLLLLHWPNAEVPLSETLGALCEVAKEGKTLAIGVSNFSVEQLKEAESLATFPIACNQVKLHLAERKDDLLAYAVPKGIAVVAYSPLGRGKFLNHPSLSNVARKHGKTPAQVALNWLLRQPGVSTIPKGTGAAHLKENLEVFDFNLDPSDLSELESLKP